MEEIEKVKKIEEVSFQECDEFRMIFPLLLKVFSSPR